MSDTTNPAPAPSAPVGPSVEQGRPRIDLCADLMQTICKAGNHAFLPTTVLLKLNALTESYEAECDRLTAENVRLDKALQEIGDRLDREVPALRAALAARPASAPVGGVEERDTMTMEDVRYVESLAVSDGNIHDRAFYRRTLATYAECERLRSLTSPPVPVGVEEQERAVDLMANDLLKWNLRVQDGAPLLSIGARLIAQSLSALRPAVAPPPRASVEAAIRLLKLSVYADGCFRKENGSEESRDAEAALLALSVPDVTGAVGHGITNAADDTELFTGYAVKQIVANALREASATEGEAEDAARFRWLCDDHGLGFGYYEKRYGISTAKWGDWPDDLREAVDAAMRAEAPRRRHE